MCNRYVAFDIETTGLSPETSEIIEIGAVRYEGEVALDSFSSLIRPSEKIADRITQITGITNEMVANEPSYEEVVPRFLDYIKDDILIGHNVAFDFSFMKVNARKLGLPFVNKTVDTLYLSRKFHEDLSSKSLEAMCRHYNVINEHAHRAYDDAVACAKIYQEMYKQYATDNAQIFKPKQLSYKEKKEEKITERQKMYLNDLLKYHKINLEISLEELTKREASRLIDKTILKYGRIMK